MKPPVDDRWKRVPQQQRQQLYSFILERNPSGDLATQQGKALVQEVLNAFPPGTIDAAGVRKVRWHGRRRREARLPLQAAALY